MKPTSISMSVSFPVDLGKTCIKPFVSVTAELQEGDDLTECAKILHEQVCKLWTESAERELAWYKKMNEGTSLRVAYDKIGTLKDSI